MSGEYIQAKEISQYWKELKAYYLANSPVFKEISQADYEAIQRSEREDSDNHYNQERLGNDTQVVDIAFYKYLPNSQIAHRIHVVDVDGKKEDHFFIVESFA